MHLCSSRYPCGVLNIPLRRASLFSKRWIALKRAATLKVGGKVPFWERVMAGCEMLPCGLSQENGGSSAELPSPLCHYKHTLMTKCVIDVHLKVKAGVFLWTYWSFSLSPIHTNTLSLCVAFGLLNHCHHWLKGVRQTWRNKEPAWRFPSLETQWTLPQRCPSIHLSNTAPGQRLLSLHMKTLNAQT